MFAVIEVDFAAAWAFMNIRTFVGVSVVGDGVWVGRLVRVWRVICVCGSVESHEVTGLL